MQNHTIPDADSIDRFDALIAHVPGILYRCRAIPGFPLIWTGGQVKETIGYSPEELLCDSGGAWSNLIHPEDKTRVLAEMQTALDARERWKISFRIIGGGGKRAWVKGIGGGRYDSDGHLVALEGVIIDMTAQMAEKEDWQVRAQEARDRNVRIVSATSDMLETLQSLSVLSINASIEAARAGDAGRGFSVVAQEMNRLAARAESTATAIRRATGSDVETLSGIFRQTETSSLTRRADNSFGGGWMARDEHGA